MDTVHDTKRDLWRSRRGDIRGPLLCQVHIWHAWGSHILIRYFHLLVFVSAVVNLNQNTLRKNKYICIVFLILENNIEQFSSYSRNKLIFLYRNKYWTIIQNIFLNNLVTCFHNINYLLLWMCHIFFQKWYIF